MKENRKILFAPYSSQFAFIFRKHLHIHYLREINTDMKLYLVII